MDFLSKAKRIVTNTAKNVSKGASDVMDYTKCKYQEISTKDEINQYYEKIGKIVYDNYKGKTDSTEGALSLCQKIEELEQSLLAIDETLSTIKNVKKCEVCDKEIAVSSAFCPHCGEKLSDK